MAPDWSAVLITLANDVNVATPASMRDIEARIGNQLPATNADPATISTINTLCAFKAGQLGSVVGGQVRLPCNGAVNGRVVTIQIK
jgi:hypothetical protein